VDKRLPHMGSMTKKGRVGKSVWYLSRIEEKRLWVCFCGDKVLKGEVKRGEISIKIRGSAGGNWEEANNKIVTRKKWRGNFQGVVVWRCCLRGLSGERLVGGEKKHKEQKGKDKSRGSLTRKRWGFWTRRESDWGKE